MEEHRDPGLGHAEAGVVLHGPEVASSNGLRSSLEHCVSDDFQGPVDVWYSHDSGESSQGSPYLPAGPRRRGREERVPRRPGGGQVVADRLQQLTGEHLDGARLIDAVLMHGRGTARVAINRNATGPELDEQKCLANLVKGLFSMYRNPATHEPRLHRTGGSVRVGRASSRSRGVQPPQSSDHYFAASLHDQDARGHGGRILPGCPSPAVLRAGSRLQGMRDQLAATQCAFRCIRQPRSTGARWSPTPVSRTSIWAWSARTRPSRWRRLCRPRALRLADDGNGHAETRRGRELSLFRTVRADEQS
ncbi:TIGR02391 family protein [Streptomyces sp. NPDC050534]|uniref:TIGR02391 family protein n=1 Tax=Streptomyces sp. NPDC050534 TaxID=3365625 RepID=UPI0037999464